VDIVLHKEKVLLVWEVDDLKGLVDHIPVLVVPVGHIQVLVDHIRVLAVLVDHIRVLVVLVDHIQDPSQRISFIQ
jgi:hypothetical protein